MVYKWEIYKDEDGSLVKHSDNDVFEYNFPENKTDKNQGYTIKYDDGITSLSTTHIVYTGDCVEERTEGCKCENIHSNSCNVNLVALIGPSGKKPQKTVQCFADNGCKAYITNNSESWLNVEYLPEEDVIKFEAKSEGEEDDRTATVNVYATEDKTGNPCYTYNVTQDGTKTQLEKLCLFVLLIDSSECPNANRPFFGNMKFEVIVTKDGMTVHHEEQTVIDCNDETSRFTISFDKVDRAGGDVGEYIVDVRVYKNFSGHTSFIGYGSDMNCNDGHIRTTKQPIPSINGYGHRTINSCDSFTIKLGTLLSKSSSSEVRTEFKVGYNCLNESIDLPGGRN